MSDVEHAAVLARLECSTGILAPDAESTYAAMLQATEAGLEAEA
jgi:hypothetical protein